MRTTFANLNNNTAFATKLGDSDYRAPHLRLARRERVRLFRCAWNNKSVIPVTAFSRTSAFYRDKQSHYFE